ncbi:hypothetical protein Dimus_035983, partial [Dionaea muscipula]
LNLNVESDDPILLHVAGMSRIFKRVTGLYDLTAKNVAAEVLGDASATSSEATPLQSLGVVPLQEVRMEEATTSVQEQPPIRPTSPKGRILRSRAQTQKKASSPPVTVDSGATRKALSPLCSVKRKRAPARTREVAGGDARDVGP